MAEFIQNRFQSKQNGASKGTISKILEKYKFQGNVNNNFQFSDREEAISEVPQTVFEDIIQKQEQKNFSIADLKLKQKVRYWLCFSIIYLQNNVKAWIKIWESSDGTLTN
ncbi:hypothetical protein ABPG72_001763 [Tetrahymena utriculariae]